MKTLVSGIKPTGTLHLGNYFGVIKGMVDLVNKGEYEAYIFIADYHALTSVKNATELQRAAFNIACAYLACGLDESKVAIFKQSSVPEHTELAWIFNNVTTVPFLMRAHAFKDHEAKNKEVSVGLFDYPVLMAADILLYDALIVPVGEDQRQHIEYARDIAGFFNRTWGEEFLLPKEYIVKELASVKGTDGQKMSKSYGNVIPLFGSDEELKKAVSGIVSDSKRPDEKKNPDENNIYNIHKLFLTKEEDAQVRSRYEEGGLSYKEAKEMLLGSLHTHLDPMREKYFYYQAHPEHVEKILKEGGKRAKEKAEKKMATVRKVTGLTK